MKHYILNAVELDTLSREQLLKACKTFMDELFTKYDRGCDIAIEDDALFVQRDKQRAKDREKKKK